MRRLAIALLGLPGLQARPRRGDLRLGRRPPLRLDPESFRRLCEDEARPPGDDAAIVARGGRGSSRTAASDDRVR